MQSHIIAVRPCPLVQLWFIIMLSLVLAAAADDDGWPLSPDDMLDVCIDSNLHKSRPGPEDKQLHNQCSSWSSRSCCTHDISRSLHFNETWIKFNWDHCSGGGGESEHGLSERCRKHFVQDLCFYQCSPNVGPWLVKVDRSWRKTRFMHVPLCAADCDQWFSDCKDSYTCRANWGRGFNWTSGENVCPSGSTCRTFSEIYGDDPAYFCEAVWDYSFKYTPGDTPCMTLTPESDDTNHAVTRARVEEIRQLIQGEGTSGGHTLAGVIPLVTLIHQVLLQLALYL